MPDDYGRRLSAVEIDDVIAYLKSLRLRDMARVAAEPITGSTTSASATRVASLTTGSPTGETTRAVITRP